MSLLPPKVKCFGNTGKKIRHIKKNPNNFKKQLMAPFARTTITACDGRQCLEQLGLVSGWTGNSHGQPHFFLTSKENIQPETYAGENVTFSNATGKYFTVALRKLASFFSFLNARKASYTHAML